MTDDHRPRGEVMAEALTVALRRLDPDAEPHSVVVSAISLSDPVRAT
ncbi:MAG: hypothetical protein WAU75_26620 [Solirubrobacteraceae bacterium]